MFAGFLFQGAFICQCPVYGVAYEFGHDIRIVNKFPVVTINKRDTIKEDWISEYILIMLKADCIVLNN